MVSAIVAGNCSGGLHSMKFQPRSQELQRDNLAHVRIQCKNTAKTADVACLSRGIALVRCTVLNLAEFQAEVTRTPMRRVENKPGSRALIVQKQQQQQQMLHGFRDGRLELLWCVVLY